MSASDPTREPSCKTCGIVYYADRPGICDCSPPYRPPMNYQERARRAELLLAEMDSALSLVLASHVGLSDYTPEEKAAHLWRAQQARGAWSSHRADLDTLDLLQREETK